MVEEYDKLAEAGAGTPTPQPQRDFAEAIDAIAKLILSVISDNKQLSVDVSALRVQVQRIRTDLDGVNAVVYKTGNGKDAILIRLEHLETTAQHIENNLKRDSKLFHSELTSLQSQILRHLEEVKEKEDKNKAKQERKGLVDRSGLWKVLAVILAAILGVLTTWIAIGGKDSVPEINIEEQLRLHMEKDTEGSHMITRDGGILHLPND